MQTTERTSQLDILMKKYALLREEIMFHFRTAKLHTKYFQAFFAACLVIGWYLFFLADKNRLAGILLSINITHIELLTILILGMDITSYYFAFDILDCYYCIFLAAARLSSIEERINWLEGDQVLIWESKFQREPAVIFGATRVTITLFQMGLVGVVSLAIPAIVYWKLWAIGNPTEKIWIGIAGAVCAALSLLFLYVCLSLFVTKRGEPLRIIRQLTATHSEAVAPPPEDG